jgi:hypothetical protein
MRIFAALVNRNEYNREAYFLYELINNKWCNFIPSNIKTRNGNVPYSKEFILKYVADTYPVYIIRKSKTLDNFYVEEGDLNERLC